MPYRPRLDPDSRSLLRRAYEAAVTAADPAAILERVLPAAPSGRLLVVGAGKAVTSMASAVERHYGPEVALRGLVIAPDGYPELHGRIEVVHASHPVPDDRAVAATERILSLVSSGSFDDRVIVLISGGASSLMCAPNGVDLAEKSELTRELLRSGADIAEMNTVRKHLSLVKGGRLGAAAAPAPVTALVLSDVVGDDLATVGSGPTVADPSTFRDAIDVLERYDITAPAARRVLTEGYSGGRPDTPKPGGAELNHVETLLVGTNQRSLEAAAEVLSKAGYQPHILSSTITGEAREVGRVHSALVRQILDRGQPFPPPCALISGGETTVSVRKEGRGGRNSEFALSLALGLPSAAPVAVLAADTDGIDGTEENAGVFVTPELLERMDRRRARRLLAANDSYTFFAQAAHLLSTGPTGTNVNDLRIALVGTPSSGEPAR